MLYLFALAYGTLKEYTLHGHVPIIYMLHVRYMQFVLQHRTIFHFNFNCGWTTDRTRRGRQENTAFSATVRPWDDIRRHACCTEKPTKSRPQSNEGMAGSLNPGTWTRNHLDAFWLIHYMHLFNEYLYCAQKLGECMWYACTCIVNLQIQSWSMNEDCMIYRKSKQFVGNKFQIIHWRLIHARTSKLVSSNSCRFDNRMTTPL